MKFKTLLVCTTLAITSLSASFLCAKDYAIEVILFTNKNGIQQSAEQFNFNHVIPVPTNGLDLTTVDSDSAWRPIPEDDYILNDVATKLNRSSNYRILKHLAWRQPAVEKKDSQPISIQAGRDFTQQYPEHAYRQIEFSDTSRNNTENSKVIELDGTINIVITRYIHLYTDLVYRLPRTIPNEISDALDRNHALVDYSVKSHRRMRSRELHYIDHPFVGIIVEATPIDEDQ
ncbi:MAG: CsiV family protein [Gammaproteobacteria bacterium]|nr:CsiV family protein [Gammaproteobacteria bacterium]